MPAISILLPTYNRAHILTRSVESIRAQSFTDWELIIIDDGSRDNTKELANSFLKDKRISYVYRENGGCQAARNTGAALAKGEWLAFADSDDQWTPDKLKRQWEYLLEHPSAQLISCAYELSLPDGGLLRIPAQKNKEVSLLPDMLFQNFIGSPTILIRRELFLSTGGLREDYPALDDWELCLRLLNKGLEIGFINEVMVHAAVSESSMSGNAAAYYDARCRLLADYRSLYEKHGCFLQACADLISRAAGEGISEQVKELMALRLAEGTRA